MTENMIAFILWIIMGAAFIGLGIYNMRSKRAMPFGFWANAKTFPVKDVRAYNRALGKLWCVFGSIFMVLGFPLLGGEESPWIVLSVVGIMFEAIGAMIIYVVVIEPKYRKKD